MRAVSAPRASGGAIHARGLCCLAPAQPARSLPGHRADEETIEGPVWLAILNGPAELLENDVLYAGQTFVAGWHVVKGHRFSHVYAVGTGEDRRHVQLEDDNLFNVNAMIHVTGVRFTSIFGRGGAARPLLRLAVAGG